MVLSLNVAEWLLGIHFVQNWCLTSFSSFKTSFLSAGLAGFFPLHPMTITEAERQMAKKEQTEKLRGTEDTPEEGQRPAEVWKHERFRYGSVCPVQKKVIIFRKNWSVDFLTLRLLTATNEVTCLKVCFSSVCEQLLFHLSKSSGSVMIVEMWKIFRYLVSVICLGFIDFF